MINMEDRVIKINKDNPQEFSDFITNKIEQCIHILARGGVIVFPTETLYGLGVDINNDQAIDRLLSLKGRPKNMPIAVAVADLKQAEQVAKISENAKRFIIDIMPKPLTLLLPVKQCVSVQLTGGLNLVGLRFPDEPVTHALLERYGPLTATSANVHGKKDPVNIADALAQLGSQVDMYIDTGQCKIGKPSTVVDISGNTIKIIRYGACSGEELERYC